MLQFLYFLLEISTLFLLSPVSGSLLLRRLRCRVFVALDGRLVVEGSGVMGTLRSQTPRCSFTLIRCTTGARLECLQPPPPHPNDPTHTHPPHPHPQPAHNRSTIPLSLLPSLSRPSPLPLPVGCTSRSFGLFFDQFDSKFKLLTVFFFLNLFCLTHLYKNLQIDF